jgi:hypothetical protein
MLSNLRLLRYQFSFSEVLVIFPEVGEITVLNEQGRFLLQLSQHR